ncbi:MAG: cobaltochelatase subunit CobN [Verrucomicrobiota bacterium]
MHRITTQPGEIDAERELVLIEQSPSEILFLSTADTDLACAVESWGALFGSRLRLAHAGPLRQPVASDDYVERVIRKCKLVVIRLLGGESYFPHLFSALALLMEEETRPQFLFISATDATEDFGLLANDFSLEIRSRFYDYFQNGGSENFLKAAKALDLLSQNKTDSFPDPTPMPDCGLYYQSPRSSAPLVSLWFYRAWYQTGDLAVIRSLIESFEGRGLRIHASFAHSLKKNSAQNFIQKEIKKETPEAILVMHGFSMASGGAESSSVFETIDVPVFQVPISIHSREHWLKSSSGLTPTEVAMNIALPEIDGRLFTTVVGFKEEDKASSSLEFTVKHLLPDHKQISHVTELVSKWIQLRKTENADKRVAIILSNYPNKNGRIGNGVGLDTPASTVAVLDEMKKNGYQIDPLPQDGEELMTWLQSGVTNDPEHSYGKPASLQIPATTLQSVLESLSESRRGKPLEQWPIPSDDSIPLAGIQLGNVFIGIQPPRGFSEQTQAIYHSPDLPPSPYYLAFYAWIRRDFNAHAIIHFGKHGNLEWLPGRSTALSDEDYPFFCLGAIPHLYPFIVNNPGEGSQAKRRTSAVIVDHLTPPLTRAGLYEDLEVIERLLEEHAHFSDFLPQRAKELEEEIQQKLTTCDWNKDLPQNSKSESKDFTLETISHFLCEIKESQIRSALHIFGNIPTDEKQTDFLLSVLRQSSGNRPGLLEAINPSANNLENLSSKVRDDLELQARQWIENALISRIHSSENESLAILRRFLHEQLLPRFLGCRKEIDQLLRGLDGKFISPGPAGSPTRGRVDILPTGRNFFAIDPRVLPTPTSWKCGQAMANALLERHRQEHGSYPRTIALVIWGTSNMRTGGDDIAQALWLWGCEPVWEPHSGRVIDFNILPVSLLGRSRVDLVLRISGLFRDAFGDTVKLLATIPKRLAELDETDDENAVRAAWRRDTDSLQEKGFSADEAQRQAKLRVFSSGPGCYGTGLLPLIDAGNWETSSDLAEVFCRWGQYAYASDGSPESQPDLLKDRLRTVEVVHQNQDNREHDILDSDDYFQFQGGLHATIKHLTGVAPATYHGDSSRPDQPKVRTIQEELIHVLRSRVLNPKWISAMRNHGYKGAFEMSATIDYLFGYDATCEIVEDHHYEAVAQKLLLDPQQQIFFKRFNPAAFQESTRRLLEAHERQLWEKANPETLSALEQLTLELAGEME